MNVLALDLIQQCLETQNPELDLGRCNLTDADFVTGEWLDIELRKCVHLHTLILSNSWYDYYSNSRKSSGNTGANNVFSTFPPAISCLKELLYLVFAGDTDHFRGIPDMSFVSGLTKLVYLDLSNNRIQEIKGLENLKVLEVLDLSSNRIDIMKGLEGLTNLQILNISSNTYLTKIRGLESLTSLHTLNVSYNFLGSIQGIEKLTSLRNLDVSTNEIIEINGIEHLIQLQSLNLCRNLIRDISPLIPFLRRDNFPLSIVADEDGKCNVGEINVGANKINTPPADTVMQGNEAILAYFENLRISKIIPFREAKVIILGEPDAGKSSLMNYFLGKPFKEEKSVTRGVNIEKCKFKYKGNEYQINFWDFGGQEVQQSVHQYFLTENTLYLIILNAVTDEQPDKYLQFLESHAPNSPFIIVTNKDDLNGNSKLNNNTLFYKYKGRIVSCEYRISVRQASKIGWCNNDSQLYLKRKKDLLNLYELVKKSFLELPHIEHAFLLNYKKVKDVVEGIYEKERKPYVTMQEFQTYCNAAGIVPGTEKSLLNHLNFIGTVRYIDKDNLRGLHILNPEWLSDGIYRIITDGCVKNKRNGKIEKEDIVDLLKPARTSEYTYQDNEIDFIITMMCHFRVAYFDDQSKFLYIPDSFPDDLPQGFNKPEFIRSAKHYFFSYDIEIPSYIISRFIVKMFRHVKRNVYWNKGIVLEYKEHKSNYCEALIEQNDRKIDIWIKGKDIVVFFGIIREAIRNSHEENFKKFEEVIVLPEETVNYHDVLNLKLDGDNSFKSKRVIDGKTGKLKQYNINEVLGIFETDNELYRQEHKNIIINSGRDTIVDAFFMNKVVNMFQSTAESATSIEANKDPHKKDRLKARRRNGWIVLVTSLVITVMLFWVMQQERVSFMDAKSWTEFKNSYWVKLGSVCLAMVWNGVIIKLWYDRVFDKAK